MKVKNATPLGTALNESCNESAKVWQQMGQVARLKFERDKKLKEAMAHAVCGDRETMNLCLFTSTHLTLQAQDITTGTTRRVRTYQLDAVKRQYEPMPRPDPNDGFCWYICAGRDHEPSIADDFEDALSLKLFYSLEGGVPSTTHRVTVKRAHRLEDAACKRHKVKSIMWA